MRLGWTLMDNTWTDRLPIFAWLIEHPECLVLIDTGETARASQPGYFPQWHPFFRRGARVHVGTNDEIGPQLRGLGFSPDDVDLVVMTHLHTDHAGGLSHFPNAKIVVARREYRVAAGRLGQLRGFLPHRWPSWFSPTLVDLDDGPYGPFPSSHVLTQAGDLILVPTCGHSPGHLAVVLDEGDRVLLFAGDASYTEEHMLTGAVDGLALNERKARETLRRIRAMASERTMVYLPSHDPESSIRLHARTPAVASRP